MKKLVVIVSYKTVKKMIRNILYVFQYDKPGVIRAVFWEWVHGMFIAAPSGILLVVLWELFEEVPDIQMIWITIGSMALLFRGQIYVAKKAMLSSNLTTYEMGRKIRLALGNKLQKLSLGYYKKRDPGDLASIVLQDVANFENIFGHSVTNITNALFGTVILSAFLLFIDWRLATTLIVALSIAIPLIRFSRWLVEKYGKKHIRARNATSARFLEYVQGIRYIKSYGMTGECFRSLDKALVDLRKESIRVEAIPGPVVLSAGVVFEVFFILMIWLALYYFTNGTLGIPTFIAFLIIGYRLYEPMKILMVEYPILSYMNVSLRRVIEVLESKEQEVGKNLTPQSYDIRFENVDFSYTNEKKVLTDISFYAPANTMTALVGPSGSGKTTITALMARFWDIRKGKISIGGISLQDMSPATVYGLISEVFQDVYLFDDSIYNNIRIGNPHAGAEKIHQVAQKAQVLEFADTLPKGLNTKVGEGGSKLSGGQKQRISIARALLKDAPIILLDEATASLDPENEIYIQDAISELVKHKTVIVIAHKLATIRQADNILVLDKGRLIESGKHEALLQQNGLYTKLWTTQQKSVGWKFTSHLKTFNEDVS